MKIFSIGTDKEILKLIEEGKLIDIGEEYVIENCDSLDEKAKELNETTDNYKDFINEALQKQVGYDVILMNESIRFLPLYNLTKKLIVSTLCNVKLFIYCKIENKTNDTIGIKVSGFCNY